MIVEILPSPRFVNRAQDEEISWHTIPTVRCCLISVMKLPEIPDPYCERAGIERAPVAVEHHEAAEPGTGPERYRIRLR